MGKTIEIVYTVKPKGEKDWQNNKIVSNVEEKSVTWEIPESLSKEIIEKSNDGLEARLLLEYAEMQKRNLQYEIEGLDNLELTIKTKTDSVKQMLESVLIEQDKVFESKHKEINEKINKFEDMVENSTKQIKNISKPIDEFSATISKINAWGVKDFFETIEVISKLQEKNPNLMKFIIDNFSVK